VPLYEYECESGHRFERIQKFSDPPIDKCPTCESTVRKLLSSPAIQFKGSGWYITDYAKKSAGSQGSDGAKKSEGSEKSDKAAAAAEKSGDKASEKSGGNASAKSSSDSTNSSKGE
jgi:putative FmdB family regulatory protein